MIDAIDVRAEIWCLEAWAALRCGFANHLMQLGVFARPRRRRRLPRQLLRLRLPVLVSVHGTKVILVASWTQVFVLVLMADDVNRRASCAILFPVSPALLQAVQGVLLLSWLGH